MLTHPYRFVFLLCFLVCFIAGAISECRAEEEENSAYHESEERPRVTTSEERRIDEDGTFHSIPDSAMERIGKEDQGLKSFHADKNKLADILHTSDKRHKKILKTKVKLMSANQEAKAA